MKYIGFFLEYLFFVILKFIVLLLGFKRSKKIGKWLGRVMFKYLRNYKESALKNAEVIYGRVDENVIKMLEKAFENVGIFLVDSFFINGVTKENFSEFVEFEDFKYIEEALSHKRGVIVVTGHFGNWEFLAGVPARLGLVDLGVVMNRQINPFTEMMIVNTRRKAKMKTFYNQPEEMKKIISHLKNNGVLGMVVDQAYYFDPIFVEFFGTPAPTARGPAVFHLKFKSPIVPARSILMEDGRYKLKFYPPMNFDMPLNEESVKTIMRHINKIFEEWILELPEQWFSWTHPRWNVEGIIYRKKQPTSTTP